MAVDFNLLLFVMQLMLYCLGAFGRSIASCDEGQVWNALLRVCECPQWTYWYDPTRACESCQERCRGEVAWCEAQDECRGYLQSLTSTVQPASTESSWTVPPAFQISGPLTELKTWELAVIFIGVVLFILILVTMYLSWTVCKLKMLVSKIAGSAWPLERQGPKDHTVEKMRYEPDGALTDEERRSTHLQPDTQETEELLSHEGAQCAHVATSPSDDTVRHSPASDTELHKPSVNEHGDILQQHHDAENSRQ